MKRLNNEIFISRAEKIHNNTYDYSLVEYVNSHTRVKIICKEHGIFEQLPGNHLYGKGCNFCRDVKIKRSKLSNNETFISKAEKIHNNTYDYSLVEYVNSQNSVKIICKEHGIFTQTPNNHISKKYGCPKCSNKDFNFDISIFEKIHNNRYDYSLVEYENMHTNIKIICKEHGIFEQTPNNHKRGSNCPKCFNKNITTKEFIEKCKKNSLYYENINFDYNHTVYKNMNSDITIECKEHGVFSKNARLFMNGYGCPKCSKKISRGEEKIKKYLELHNINYIREFTFEELKDKSYLKFDFFLPDYNTCIEYDGVQHFKIVEHFGGLGGFLERKFKDEIKNEYCKENNICLIRIPYTKFNDIDKIIYKTYI